MGEPGIRISDAERKAVVDLLRHHTVEGRLTLDEFSDLVGQVYATQTRGALDQLLADLPEGVRPAPATPATPATPAAPATPSASTPATPASAGAERDATAAGRRRGERRRWFVAVMCDSQARGAWRAPPQISAFSWWGQVNLDLRRALIESPVVEIRAWALMGGVTVTVPPGIPVELDGFVIMGDARTTVDDDEPIPDAPLVRVRARGLWGGVRVRNPGRGGDTSRATDAALDRAEQQVARARSRARRATERALPRGAGTDAIPSMPDRPDIPDRAEPAQASDRTSGRSSGRGDPTTPPGAGAAPGNGDLASTASPAAGPARGIPSGTLTMLVSDIAGSTEMAEQLGDQAWLDVLHAHNDTVRGRVAEHGGTEVKAQGDGFLVVFPSARAAVLAAIAIQQAMRDYCDQHPELPVQVRLGLHTGEVVVADDDVFGRNVVVASRIAETAEPGEIVVSGLTRDLTASASDLGFDGGRDVRLKGMPQEWRVHRVLWS